VTGRVIGAIAVAPGALQVDLPQATNLVLRPGLVVGDVSLQLYFDAPAPGWTLGTVSLAT
jgi:hypothetical protein